MTALLLAAVLPAAVPLLDLRVTVLEAVEDGPFVFEVSLTNRGSRPLAVGRTEGKDCEITLPDDWPRGYLRGCGYRMPTRTELASGQTWTERHAFHVEWTGRILAGPAEFTVAWPLSTPREFDGSGGRPIVTLERAVAVTVAPATPAVLAGVARRARADIAEGKLDAAAGRLLFTPHKPLTPVALELLDRCPVGPEGRRDETFYLRRQLVGTVFGADPAAAHRLFVGRLTARPAPADPAAEFTAWDDARRTVEEFGGPEYRADLVWCLANARPPLWYSWRTTEEVLGLLAAVPRLPPPAELRRLAAADDFWVRALTFAAFADRLDPAWQDAFLRDVHGRPLDRRAELVLASLGDQPGAGRLLDALAAGPAADPVATAARKRRAGLR